MESVVGTQYVRLKAGHGWELVVNAPGMMQGVSLLAMGEHYVITLPSEVTGKEQGIMTEAISFFKGEWRFFVSDSPHFNAALLPGGTFAWRWGMDGPHSDLDIVRLEFVGV